MKLKVGNVNQKVSTIEDADDVWVMAEVTPDQWVAMETTGGFVVCPDTNFLQVIILCIFMDGIIPAQKIYKTCFVVQIRFVANSVCINNKCEGCNLGYLSKICNVTRFVAGAIIIVQVTVCVSMVNVVDVMRDIFLGMTVMPPGLWCKYLLHRTVRA